MRPRRIATLAGSLLWRGGRYSVGRLGEARTLLDQERQVAFRDEFGLTRRIQWYYRGYTTRSAVLYALEEGGSDRYLNDIENRRKNRVNGPERAFPIQKFPFHVLVANSFPTIQPELYGLISDGTVFDETLETIAEDALDWLTATLEDVSRLVLKPQDGYGGRDVFVLEWNDGDVAITGEPTGLSDLQDLLSDHDGYLAVEHVEQSGYAAEIYPKSVNTIRVLTLWDYRTGRPYVADAIHRFGVEASRPVDNWDRGGLSVGIDLETGTLLEGTRSPESPELEWFERHPDTGVRFTGVRISGWETLGRLCCELAAAFWYVPMMAWDIAVTDEGPTVIEGNSRPSIEMMQVHRPLLADERTRRFFAHHDVI